MSGSEEYDFGRIVLSKSITYLSTMYSFHSRAWVNAQTEMRGLLTKVTTHHEISKEHLSVEGWFHRGV